MKLIDKDALVAEIDKKLDKYSKSNSFNYGAVKDLEYLRSFLNTLEVKEVDLEEEVANWWDEHYAHIKKGYTFEGYTGHYMENSTVISLAKHFYELGLKTLKGE